MNKNTPKIPRQRQAFALLLALASTLLISSIVLVFFNRATFNRTSSAGSANSMKANQIALSALDVLTAEIQHEIRDTSKSTVQGTSPNQAFLPKKATTDLLATTNAGIDRVKTPNLLKVTRAGSGLWSSGRTMASGVDTETPSLNRRSVSTDLWERNGMHSGAGNDTLDTLASPPDWVYITQGNGIKDDPAVEADKYAADYAIGRFAATVYDVSGLIDLNTAGHLDELSAAQEAELVGSLASLDLSQLTATAGSAQAAFGDTNAVEAYIKGFRNKGSRDAGLAQYQKTITEDAAKVGSLHPVNNDNMLLSRKDLLRLDDVTPGEWGTKSGVAGSPSQAPAANGSHLFTHYSREKNSPAWGPSYNASDHGGNGFDYLDDREKPTEANRLLPTVRVKNSFTRRDGSTAEIGEPLMKTRFPLSKLELLTPTAVAGTEISDYFGLARQNPGDPWVYRNGAAQILTLDEVANAGREPDFFEVLKAGVLSGSLGLASGAPTRLGKPTTDKYDNADYQILQLGANIIDQYDADSFPTVLRMASANDWEAYGIESLPYINKVHDRFYRPGGGDRVHSWIQFDVWNPHEDAGDATVSRPRLRLLMSEGSVRMQMRSFDNRDTKRFDDTEYFEYVGPNWVPALPVGAFQVTSPNPLIRWDAPDKLDTASTTPSIEFVYTTAFEHPTLLGGTNTGTLSGSVEDLAALSPPLEVSGVGIKVWDRSDPVPDRDRTGDPTHSHASNLMNSYEDLATFELQYWNGNKWITYQKVEGFGAGPLINDGQFPNNLPTGFNDAAHDNPERQSGTQYAAVDPRTMRFGMQAYGGSTQGIGEGYDGAVLPDGGNNVGNKEKYSNRFRPSLSGHFFPQRPFNLTTQEGRSGNSDSSSYTDGNTENLFQWAFNNGPGNNDGPHYVDLDEIKRYADGYDGVADASTAFYSTGTDTTLQDEARPVMLNRPFRSVGELGHVHRDLPWKTLDLFTERSPDAGLVDLFSVTNDSEMVAGKLSLMTNTYTSDNQAIALLMEGVPFQGDNSLTMDANEAKTAANALLNTVFDDVTGNVLTPINNAGDLSTILEQATVNVGGAQYNTLAHGREVMVRALAGVNNSRTWNLMVDVVAQSGRFTQASGGLADFYVEGERRYWMHVAIDRLTGKIIDRQIELAQ